MNTKTLAMAAAALSATVFCPTVFGEITSANVVGYTTTDTPGSDCYLHVTPKFVCVDNNTKVTLKSMTFEGLSNYDTLQIFDEEAELATQLTYRTNKKIAGVVTVGWYDDDGALVDDYDFAKGQSFWLCTADVVKVTESGAVAQGKTVIQLPGNDCYAQTGNSLPVAVKLGDIEFEGLSNYDTIQIFDQDAELDEQLTYRTNKKVGGVVKVGWYTDDGDFVDPEVYSFAAGKAFCLCTAEAGTMTLPAAL